MCLLPLTYAQIKRGPPRRTPSILGLMRTVLVLEDSSVAPVVVIQSVAVNSLHPRVNDVGVNVIDEGARDDLVDQYLIGLLVLSQSVGKRLRVGRLDESVEGWVRIARSARTGACHEEEVKPVLGVVVVRSPAVAEDRVAALGAGGEEGLAVLSGALHRDAKVLLPLRGQVLA